MRTPAAWTRPEVSRYRRRFSYFWKLVFLTPQQCAGLPKPPPPCEPLLSQQCPQQGAPGTSPPSVRAPALVCMWGFAGAAPQSTRGGRRLMPCVHGASSESTSPTHPGGAAPPALPSGGLRQPLATPWPTWSPGAALQLRRGHQLRPGCVHAPESWPHHGRVAQHERDGHTRCPGAVHGSLGGVGTAWGLALPGALRPPRVSSTIGRRPVGDPQPCTAPLVPRGSW